MKLLQRWVIIIGTMLVSCTKLIDVSLPGHEPRLVLHGYIATGENFSVAVGRSVRPNTVTNSDETFVDNAWVLLYENDVFRDSLRYDQQQKRYVSQAVIAIPGKKYKIVAGAGGFATIEAVAMATLPVYAVSVTHEKNTRVTSYGETMDDVHFSFQDPADEKNYYLAALYPALWGRAGLVCVYSNDPAIDRIQNDALPVAEDDCIPHEEILFSDKSFNGSLKQITISAGSRSLETAVDTAGRLHYPYLKRYSISEDHYRYLKNLASLFQGGDIPLPGGPVAIKGNVENGYGLFAVFSVTTDTLR